MSEGMPSQFLSYSSALESILSKLLKENTVVDNAFFFLRYYLIPCRLIFIFKSIVFVSENV